MDCDIYIYIYNIYIYIYIVYICNHENNVPSRLSPQWLCGNSCTCAHELHKTILVITGRAHCFHDYIYIYYAHLASVRFQHSVCRGSLMTTYIYIYIYIYICIYIYIHNQIYFVIIE